jgi:hypothetical protein
MAERSLPPHAVTCLLDALRSTQEVIRSYDTKAQIMGIIFILSINFVLTLLRELVGLGPIPPVATISLAALVLVPLGLFGFVLYPANNPTAALDIAGQPIRRTYFVLRNDRDLGRYLDDIEATDWPVEIGFEIMKMARLREIKRRRLLRALVGAAISYMLILGMMVMIAG